MMRLRLWLAFVLVALARRVAPSREVAELLLEAEVQR
jgi:hypothetical protein